MFDTLASYFSHAGQNHASETIKGSIFTALDNVIRRCLIGL